MAFRFIILHTNDIHGRLDGLARVATLVERVRAENPNAPVLYFDLGDSEDFSNRLSNLTKGVAMHRLLSAAGCDAVAVGNAVMIRYGPQVIADQVRASRYPHLLANLRMPDGGLIAGTQPTTLLNLDGLRLGLVGISDPMESYTFFDMRHRPAGEVVREHAAALREQGADAVILLSHMSLEADRQLAAELQDDVALILGGHSHDLLPEGERAGRVVIAQAGNYAEHLGRVDLEWDGAALNIAQVGVLPVTESIPPSPRVVAEIEAVTSEVERFLDEIIGELAEPLDYATDRECGAGNLMADALRDRFQAEVGVLVAGHAFNAALPGGPLRRVALWDVCPSTANPGVATLTGAQLSTLVKRGLDPNRAAETPHNLRGRARGLMHLSGACLRDGQLLVDDRPLEAERHYRVAGSDYEFNPVFEYADADWDLRARYDIPFILREALEDYLAAHRPARVERGRLDSPAA